MICDFGGDAPTTADLPRSNQREIADALELVIDAARDSNHTDSWDHTQAAWTLVQAHFSRLSRRLLNKTAQPTIKSAHV